MKISVVIPTLNEAERISATLEHLQINGANDIHEIIVVNASSGTDNTAVLARQSGAHVLSCKEAGRSLQMNMGADAASGDILYFVHADVLPPKSYAQDIKESVLNANKLGFFSYQFDSDSRLLKINAWFTQFDGLLAGGGDQSLFITKAAFQQLGGFCKEHCIMEDFDLIRRARKAKMPYEIIKKDALVSARKYEKNSYLKVNLVNLLIFSLYGLGVKPTTLKRSYQQLLK